MPYYKKRYPRRRRFYRRKRYNKKRKFGLKKQLKIHGSNHLILKQKRVRNFTLTAATGLPDVRQTTFQVSDIPQIATLAELFDMYKINGVQWKLTLLQNGDGGSGANTGCQVAIIKDYDGQSGATASTWNELLERSNCKIKNLQAGTTRNSCKAYITPKIANTVWNGALASGYSSPKGKQWLDLGSPSIPHYSIICGLNPYENATPGTPGLSGTFVFQVELTYYLTFKQVR